LLLQRPGEVLAILVMHKVLAVVSGRVQVGGRRKSNPP